VCSKSGRSFWQSGFGCTLPTVMSYPGFSTLFDLSLLSEDVVISWLYCPGCSILTALSRLNCPGCPVLSQLSLACRPLPIAPSLLTCPCCPVLVSLSLLSCPCRLMLLRQSCSVLDVLGVLSCPLAVLPLLREQSYHSCLVKTLLNLSYKDKQQKLMLNMRKTKFLS
jgi:hypothetical protein